MALDLNGIEQAISVGLGSGSTGQLAGGAAAAGFIADAQNWLSAKGSQVGVALGSLGLSGFLASASAGANKSTTAQAQSLLGLNSKSIAIYAFAGIVAAYAAVKYVHSKILAVLILAGTAFFYKMVNTPTVSAPAGATAGDASTRTNIFSSVTGLLGGLVPTNLGQLFSSAPGETNASPSTLADSNGTPAPNLSVPVLSLITDYSTPSVLPASPTPSSAATQYIAPDQTPPPTDLNLAFDTSTGIGG